MSYFYRFLKKNLFILTLFISHAVFSQPVINSFSPTNGPVGTYVTIFGTGFNTFADSNIVYFGGVRANVFGASDTSITVTAPAGTTYQPITVTTGQLTAYSDKPFIITFGGDVAFTAGSLAAKTDFTSGATTVSITSADLNGDGKSELIAANYGGNSISIFKNKSTPGNISLNAAQIYATSTGRPTSVTTGDLDGDGKPDVIAAIELNNVSIFRNTSLGDSILLGTELLLTTGNYAQSVSVNDLDGDGKPDVAVTNNQSNTVTVYRNTSTAGIISFASPITFSTGATTQSVAIGDIDGDKKPELVVTNYFAYTVSVFRNTSTPGTIAFASKTDFATGAQPYLVAIGDLDGDGKADLVTGNSNALTVSVLRNTSSVGSISFAAKIDYSTGQTPYGVAIGDIDGDGKPDIATGNYSANNMSLLKNTSTPGSISFLPRTDYTSGNSPYSVCIADLDGDGKPELATANFGGGSVSVFRNKIKESAITSFSPTTGATGTHVTIIGTYFTGATAVTFGGMSADSFAVISDTLITAIVGHGNSGNVSVATPYGTATKAGFTYDSTGNDTLPPVITLFSPTSGHLGTGVSIRGHHFTGAIAVSFGGVNARSFHVFNDSIMVATVGTGNTGSVVVTTPFGSGSKDGFTFVPIDSSAPVITSIIPLSGPVGTTVTITGHHFSTSATGNVVYFGAISAVVTSANDSTIITTVPNGATYKPVTVTKNFLTGYYEHPFNVTFPGTGFTSASFAAKQDFTTGSYPRCVSMSDLDGDGKTDMVVVNNVGNTISVYRNTASVGSISFTTKTDYDAGKNPMNATVGDIDGDGKQDVIIASYDNDTIIIYKNISTTGTISFTPAIKLATGINPIVVAVRDLNGDGKPDIITVNQNGNNVAVLKNTGALGSISFNTRYYFPVGNWPDGLTVADLNGDGKPDIVAANNNDNTISVLKNQSTTSTISFATKVDYATGTGPFHVCAGDLNGDGKPEIIVANVNSSNISVYNNTSDSTISLSPKTDYLTASGPLFPSVDNLDGDGKPDVSVADFYASQLSILKNVSDSGMISLNTNVDFATGFSPRYIAAGDLDGDGKPDLAVVNSNSNTVSIFRNLISDSMLITTRLITGENTNLPNEKFAIYPNPATQFVTVKHPAINHYSQIQLVDISGRLVKTMVVGNNATQTTVNLQGLTQGVYKLILSDGEKTFTGTLLVK